VGYSFIPFFQFYWCFVAFLGLAQDMNRYAKKRRLNAPLISESLSRSYCILFIITSITMLVPAVGFIFLIAMSIISIVLFKQYTVVAEQIALHKQQAA